MDSSSGPRLSSSETSSVTRKANDDVRIATIRDALLWGAVACVPLLALALLPRRSEISRLRGEISALSKQSNRQSKATLEALTHLRSRQEEALIELRGRITANANMLARLDNNNTKMLQQQESKLIALSASVMDVIAEREGQEHVQADLNRASLAALEDARSHLSASRRTSEMLTKRLALSMADIAAFMEKTELEHGQDLADFHVVERLRNFALHLEETPAESSPEEQPQPTRKSNETPYSSP